MFLCEMKMKAAVRLRPHFRMLSHTQNVLESVVETSVDE